MPKAFKRPAPPKAPRKAAPEQPPKAQREDAPEQPAKAPSRFRVILKRAGLALLVVLALAFAYLFLLLGEPDDDAKYLEAPAEERILMPMNAVETPGEANVQGLADSFDQAVLSLNGTLSMRRARIYDTAFEGGYARRVTLTYVFEDGTLLTAESLRPTAAATLFKLDGGTLDGSSLYTLGGLNAARMDNADTVCVFAQSDAAVYAILCPASHAQELDTLLHATLLTPPQQAD